MADQTKKNIVYQVSIYHLDNQFYVTSMVPMPPIGMSTPVLPVYIVPDNDSERFAEVLEAGYRRRNQEGYEVILPAKVKIFGMNT